MVTNRLDGSSYLRHRVELDHGISQRLCIAPQWWNDSQHCTIECSIDLCKRCGAWVVNIDDWYMT